MRFQVAKIVVFVLAVIGPVTSWAADPPPATPAQTLSVAPDFRVGPGDVISVSVYKEAEASVASALIRSDGKITMPLLGDIYVQGMTTGEIKNYVAKALDPKFIPGADVTVNISQIHSKKVFLAGKVRNVGPLDLTGPLTIMQALNMAGGLNDFADKKNIY